MKRFWSGGEQGLFPWAFLGAGLCSFLQAFLSAVFWALLAGSGRELLLHAS